VTDFLDRLVARAVEPSAVRPRVAGRFEHGPWADPVSARVPADAVAADRPAAPPLPPAHDSLRFPADPARRLAVPVDSPEPPRGERVLPVAAARPSASPPHPDVHGRSSRRRRAAADPDAARAEAPPPPATRESLAPPPQPPVRPASIRPTPAPARVASDWPAPPATPAMVQVRIGRVEVRATVGRAEQPAPAAPRAPRTRPLSLEAFLEGKRGRP
jgi:hypothetical protein